MATRGRPPKNADDRKESMFCVRLTAEERQAIENAAASAGVPASQWARRALLSFALGEGHS